MQSLDISPRGVFTPRRFGRLPAAVPFSLLAVLALLSSSATRVGAEEKTPEVEAPQLDGWQGMRVIKQEGSPSRVFAAALDDSGRESLVVVNTRQSRLDFYRWVPPDQRQTTPPPDADRPNELPLAPDWEHSELDLEEPPVDAVAVDLNGDQRQELVMLTTPSNKAVAYQADADGKWTKSMQWDLLPGSTSGNQELMLVRTLADGSQELLVSMDQGIQLLGLRQGARPTWLSPRENRGRLRWRLADLDGDGDRDLFEWSSQARQTIRWYECRGDQLLPAQVVYDQSISSAETMHFRDQPLELLLLGGPQEGLVRRFALTRGEESELGRRDALPMPGGQKAIWTGIQIDGQPALVAVDPAQPRLRLERLATEGWTTDESFPITNGVRAVAAPQGAPGTLLLWAKDAPDLLVSRWQAGRMSYPQSMPQSAEQRDRAIIALDTAWDTVWWVQRVANDLHLYLWPSGDSEPRQIRFEGAGAKAESAVWLGGERLLVKVAFVKGAKLAVRSEDKTTVTEPSQVSNVTDAAALGEFGLYLDKGVLRPGRMSEGVVQWLGDDLQPVDQIMLGDGQRIASFVPDVDGKAWALEEGGAFIHRLEPDEAGILRITRSIRPPAGMALVRDAVVGLMLIDQDRVVRLSRGQPWELVLRDSVDGRVGRRSGVKEATVHRVLSTDVTGDGNEEVILCDDAKHQLTVLEKQENALRSVLTWAVFEDRTYPYGGEEGSQVPEPRAVAGLDADGDKLQDLVLLCHDRLLIYLARENGE